MSSFQVTLHELFLADAALARYKNAFSSSSERLSANGRKVVGFQRNRSHGTASA